MATKDMAGLLQQLIARITKTERDLAELSGNIASLRDRIETAPREDDVEKRPTLYDSNYQAKPMREAVAAALRAAPDRA